MPSGLYIIDNLISGNTYGVILGQNGYFPIYNATIAQNFIGTDITGSVALPNQFDGIVIDSGINTLIAANTISANGANGIREIKGKNTLIKANTIGLDPTATIPLPNGLNGIQLGSIGGVGVSSFGDIIGSGQPSEGNLIAFNGGNGIALVGYTQQATIQGNVIIYNTLNGIRLGAKTSNNWIGGFRDAGTDLLAGDALSQQASNIGPIGTSNYIAYNGLDGIALVQSNQNAIQTNIILNNAVGVSQTDSSFNLIGGAFGAVVTTVPPTIGNIISDNSSYGVTVVQTTGQATDNTIISNQIVGNANSGIALIG